MAREKKVCQHKVAKSVLLGRGADNEPLWGARCQTCTEEIPEDIWVRRDYQYNKTLDVWVF